MLNKALTLLSQWLYSYTLNQVLYNILGLYGNCLILPGLEGPPGGCMNWDCINAPIPFIMSLNIFVEWGFISYDKQNDLKKVNSVKIKQQVKVQLNLFPDSERKMFFLCNGLEFNLLHKLLELIVMLTYNHSIFILQCTCIKTVMTMS